MSEFSAWPFGVVGLFINDDPGTNRRHQTGALRSILVISSALWFRIEITPVIVPRARALPSKVQAAEMILDETFSFKTFVCSGVQIPKSAYSSKYSQRNLKNFIT